MSTFPCLVRSVSPSGEIRFALGDPLVDRYLAFVAGRARAETLRAAAFDLKTFFTIVSKSPVDVVAADVFEFLAHQRGDRLVIRISDRGSGLAARTIARRLSSVSGFYAYLVARGDTLNRPVFCIRSGWVWGLVAGLWAERSSWSRTRRVGCRRARCATGAG
jgi:integrase/recombinase XerD